MSARGAVEGGFALDGPGLRGFAYDGADLGRRLVVELLVDGWPVDLARADDYAPEASGIGDGCYGFGFRLPDAVQADGGLIEVRLANTGEPVGRWADLAAPSPGSNVAGRAEWVGGLRIAGWVEAPASRGAPRVRLVVERRCVAEAEARGFVAVGQGPLRRTKARFDLRLPEAYADGRAHRVAVLDGEGRELAGSPLAVLASHVDRPAAPGAVEARDDCDPRSRLVERLTPRSVPFADVEAWSARFPPPSAHEAEGEVPVAVLLLGDDVEPSLASVDAQRHGSWYAVAAPPTHGSGTFDPAAVSATLVAEARAEVVVVLPAGSRLRPGALSRLGAVAAKGWAAVYADATVDTPAGAMPLMWPAFDPERSREQGYAALAFAAPSAMVASALRRGASSCFALFDLLAGEAVPVHLPELMIALARPEADLGAALRDASAGQAARLLAPDAETGLPRVAVPAAGHRRGAAVAVVQPEPWDPDLARVGSMLPDAAERILVSHRPLDVPRGWVNVVVAGGRNPSRLREAALAAARSPHLLLLDAGVEPEDPSALEDLASRLAAGVAAAGGVVLDEDGLIASAGLVLGPDFAVRPAFAGFDPDDSGYAGLLAVARSCGALDAAALFLDRAAALAAGGFEAALFPEHFGGADLCLKLRAGGSRLVVSPRARFVRRRAWRGRGPAAREAGELAILRRRWGADLADDPFYHPGLNLDGEPFTALAWPPRDRAPRRPRAPRMLPLTPEDR